MSTHASTQRRQSISEEISLHPHAIESDETSAEYENTWLSSKIRLECHFSHRMSSLQSVQIIGEYRWLHPDHRRPTHNGDHLLGFVGTALIPSLSPSQNEFPIPEHQNVIRLDELLHITHMDEKFVLFAALFTFAHDLL